MVKPTETVIDEFNSLVNMTPSDLNSWLKAEKSTGSGWSKGDGSGESSGREIIAILKEIPDKDPEEYEEQDIEHRRKVVSYCKRHLAQEETAKKDPNSKSNKSLNDWGHDAQKS